MGAITPVEDPNPLADMHPAGVLLYLLFPIALLVGSCAVLGACVGKIVESERGGR